MEKRAMPCTKGAAMRKGRCLEKMYFFLSSALFPWQRPSPMAAPLHAPDQNAVLPHGSITSANDAQLFSFREHP